MAEPIDYGHHYRIWHEDTDEHYERTSKVLLDELTPFLPATRDGSVLDIGCGMGFAMIAMQRAGFADVRGVDVDESQVAACRKRGLRVDRVNDVESHLSDHAAIFDFVILRDVLEHIPSDRQIPLLRAIYAAMRPGARLFIQVPNASSILAMRWKYLDFTHHTSFTEISIRFALQNAGFRRIEVPAIENPGARPSFRPSAVFDRNYRWLYKRWIVRWLWRKVLEAELNGYDTSLIPLSLNLQAIADKDE